MRCGFSFDGISQRDHHSRNRSYQGNPAVSVQHGHLPATFLTPTKTSNQTTLSTSLRATCQHPGPEIARIIQAQTTSLSGRPLKPYRYRSETGGIHRWVPPVISTRERATLLLHRLLRLHWYPPPLRCPLRWRRMQIEYLPNTWRAGAHTTGFRSSRSRP